MHRRLALCVAVVPFGLVASACSDSNEGGVESVAAAFYQALRGGNAAGACSLLAPTTRSKLEQSAQMPCAEAIQRDDVHHRVG